jgi:DNA-binding response OmpR family regulator
MTRVKQDNGPQQAKQGPPEVQAEKAIIQLPASRRILVVEDNLDSAHMLATFFGSMGHKVEYAINAIVAVHVAHRFLPEFVFLDLRLPDGHGAEVARQLRLNPHLSKTRIYAVTGSPAWDDWKRALAAGCEDVLVKPVATDVLERLVT